MGSQLWSNPKYDALVQSGKPPYLGPEVEVKFIPAPVGGWDQISPLAMMDPQYAPIFDNIVARPGWIEPRGGASNWNTVSTSPVETIIVYRPSTGIEQMFAASGSEIWDVSNLNTPTLAVNAKSNARWQYTNFTPAGSFNFIAMVNGADPYLTYNGTVWVNQVITGAASSTFINILAYKRRLWFVKSQSTIAYYLPADAISGAVSAFDVGSFLTKGGFLVAQANWTIDGGQGPDDYLAFMSNKGQVVLYKGVDPATDFTLVGVFDLPDIISNRCSARLGSDVGVITLQGLLPISQALPFNPSGVRSVALTNRIQNAMLQAAQAGQNLFGWQLIQFPAQSLTIMNVPIAENVQQVQFVMNPLNGAWQRFTGWNANCFEIFNNSLYWGDNHGSVNLGYAGYQDLGQVINVDVECAFNYLEAPGRIKNLSMLRPYLKIDIPVTIQLGVDVDFSSTSPTFPVNVLIPTGASLWDVAIWDQSLWSQASQILLNWLSVQALGTALAVRLKIMLGDGPPTGVQYISSGQGVPTLQINVFEGLMQSGGPI